MNELSLYELVEMSFRQWSHNVRWSTVIKQWVTVKGASYLRISVVVAFPSPKIFTWNFKKKKKKLVYFRIKKFFFNTLPVHVQSWDGIIAVMEFGDVVGYDKSCQEHMSKSAISQLCCAAAHLMRKSGKIRGGVSSLSLWAAIPFKWKLLL